MRNKIIVLLTGLAVAIAVLFAPGIASAHDIHPNLNVQAYVGSTSASCVKFQWHTTAIEYTYNGNLCPGQKGGEGASLYGDSEWTQFYIGPGWCVEFRWDNDAASTVYDARPYPNGVWV